MRGRKDYFLFESLSQILRFLKRKKDAHRKKENRNKKDISSRFSFKKYAGDLEFSPFAFILAAVLKDCGKLFQKTDIVFKEQPQVFNSVF